MPKLPLDDGGERPAEKPKPEFLKRDPFAEMFGPGSGVTIVGDQDDEIPDEVRAALDEFNLSKRSFQCVLKELPAGATLNGESGSQSTRYIKGWVRSIPSIEYIAKTYGPGSYILMFSWRTKSDETDGVSKAMHTEVPIEISEKFMAEYKKHQLSVKIADASEITSKVRDTLIEKKIEGSMLQALGAEGEKKSPAETAKEYITQTIETVKMLGLPFGLPAQPAAPARALEWDKLLPAIVTGAAAFMKVLQDARASREDQFNKMLMLLMTQNQNATNQMMETLKVQSGVGSGNMAIKEFKDMVLGALDIKDALAGNKETLADRIFKVVEGVAPQILSIAAASASAKAAQANPMVRMATGYINTNPDFAALRNNPEEMKAFIDKMDGFFGTKQTDVILQVAGWERPPYCPRDPAMEQPPQAVEETPPEETPPAETA